MAHADGVREPVEANLILALEHIRGGRGEQRLIEAAHAPSFAALQTLGSAIPGCAIVIPESLADEGLIHEAEQRLALILKADERAPERHSEDERSRSIDGIKRPDVVCAGIHGAELLPDDAMIGKVARENLTHAASAPLSAAVTGSNNSPPLWSAAAFFRKWDSVTLLAALASF